MLKPLRKILPGCRHRNRCAYPSDLSLIGVGVSSFGGGTSASMTTVQSRTLLLGTIVRADHHSRCEAWRERNRKCFSAILIGIIAGYILRRNHGCWYFRQQQSTAEGVEYTKAWVLNWDKVSTGMPGLPFQRLCR